LMISGGRFLTEPTGATRRVKQKNGQEVDRRVFKGKVSGRELTERDPIEWRGEKEFVALVRRIWILRCRGRLRQWDPVAAVLLSLVIEAEEDEEGVISEEELPGELSSPEKWLLDEEGLLTFVHDLARASEQLKDHPACREVVEATILYVKWRVAQCNPRWKNHSLDGIVAISIEDLVEGADLNAFDANGTEWRQFLMDVLFEEATKDEKVNEAKKFLFDEPRPNKKSGKVRELMEAARAQVASFSGEELNCNQVRPKINLLAEDVVQFVAELGMERLVHTYAHVTNCEGCLISLGDAVIADRNRNTLDQRVRRCRQVLIPLMLRLRKERGEDL